MEEFEPVQHRIDSYGLHLYQPTLVIAETVGVGQSEFEVAAMVDFFMVLLLPNAGDELQGLKKGIMELADALVINKADGNLVNNADITKQHYQGAFNLLRQRS